VALALPGLLLFPLSLRRSSGKPVRAAWITLAVHHYGLVAFSLFDFQGSGDTMILLHSIAFFGGVALLELFHLLERARLAPLTSHWLEVALAIAMLLAVRPVFSDYPPLRTRIAPAETKLSDQVTMAQRIRQLAQGKTVMVLGPTEMATLGNLEPLSNFFFWNLAAEHEYVRTRGADADNFLMLLREYQPDVVISNRDRRMPSNSPYLRAELGEPGGYRIEVFVRTPGT